MTVPLIGTHKANGDNADLFPQLDSEAKIMLTPDDGNNIVTIRADNICILEDEAKVFELYDITKSVPDKGAWEVMLTDQRIIFRHPMIAGLFSGKPKLKAGVASVGHLYYRSLGALMTGYIEPPALPFLGCCCIRTTGAFTQICITAEMNTLHRLAEALYIRLSAFMAVNGLSDDKGHIEKWDNFRDNQWLQTQQITQVVVPQKAIYHVAKSQVEMEFGG
ncbi:MAG: hypothetical protein FWC96_00770 [Oscillospiraceae bacterium]|nr:hypothetical protein [Oscillospiraceae bacterium]